MSQNQTDVGGILYSARRILRTNGWTQGGNARNSHRRIVSTWSPDAMAYCLWGAMCRANASRETGIALERARKMVLNVLPPGYGSISVFNDNIYRTKEEVITVLDKAILQLEKGTNESP